MVGAHGRIIVKAARVATPTACSSTTNDDRPRERAGGLR
jgi:hypothetical protein